MQIRSLRWRILIGVLLVDLALGVVFTFSAQRVLSDWLRQELTADARAYEHLIVAAAAPLMAELNLGGMQDLVDEMAAATDVAYIALREARTGRVLAQAGPVPPRTAGLPAPTSAGRNGTDVALTEHDGVARFAAPVRLEGQTYGELEFGLSLAGVAQGTRELVGRAVTISLAGMAVATALMMLVTGVSLRRLTRLAETARRFGRGETVAPADESGGDEVADVGAAFNEMSRRLTDRIDALAASEALQRGVAEVLVEGLLIQRTDGEVVACNQAACDALQLSDAQVRGHAPPPPGWQLLDATGERLGQRGAVRLGPDLSRPQRGQRLELRLPDGRSRWLSVNVVPQHAGAVAGLTVTSITDVTDVVAAHTALLRANEQLEARVVERTQALQRAKEDAEAANQAKTLFLSKMSHELRTPLNAILGFAQLISVRDDLPPDALRAAGEVERSGWHLLTLIEDVLDLSRIEAGVLRVDREPCAVGDIVASCAGMQQQAATRRSVTIDCRIAPGLTALADPHRLLQVLNNLVSNAVKYNHEGGRVIVSGEPQGPGAVRIAVRDTGPGLPADKMARLFQPFDRLDADRSATPGTGIGLVITRHLVEAMGGALDVSSTPGLGSTFVVTLPSAAPAAAGTPPPAAAPAPAVPAPAAAADVQRVLYVEDDAASARLMMLWFARRPDLELEVATNAERALAAADAHPPALFLLDLGLGEVDGFELARRLRERPAHRDTPMVVLTAEAMPEVEQRGLAAGFDAFLTKPVEVRGLFSTIDRLLARAAADTPPVGHAPPLRP